MTSNRDFAPVATVTYVALALVVNSSLPVNSFKELVAYTQARRGSLSYGSFGAGSQPHVMGEMYKKLTGTDLVHVPYKGAGPAVTDVLGGQILFTFPAFPTIQGHIKAGKLKVLAVSGDKRVPLAPEVPTFTEAGYKDMDIGAWYAFLAPAATPKEIIAKLNSTVAGVLADREFVEKNMTSQGMEPMTSSPEQFAELIRRNRAHARSSNIGPPRWRDAARGLRAIRRTTTRCMARSRVARVHPEQLLEFENRGFVRQSRRTRARGDGRCSLHAG